MKLLATLGASPRDLRCSLACNLLLTLEAELNWKIYETIMLTLERRFEDLEYTLTWSMGVTNE